MKNKQRRAQALGICVLAALLAACGGPQSLLGVPGAGREQASMPNGGYAGSLLYVNLESVNVFTYPHGKPLGSLGVGGGLCSDKFGNIVVAGAAGVSQVWVYPHGQSQPIANMYNPADPGGCSVDPSSEKIAVAGYFISLVTWPYHRKRGWGFAHQYVDPNMLESRYCTYDPDGNLFLDGYTSSSSFILAELPKGSSTFMTITLNQIIHKPGSMQWDGKYLVVEDAGESSSSPAVVYRFAVSGSSGTEVSATTLKHSYADVQFLIHGGTVIGAVSPSSTRGLGFWRFPDGGEPTRVISTYVTPNAEALSLK
jgi:hypothetical protein